MDLQLEGKRALVTGSTAGIGYAIAESGAAYGYHPTCKDHAKRLPA
jgi:NAD(P)-dependent dehydrogenase (short-subunit alcohol dehydrogenase family)